VPQADSPKPRATRRSKPEVKETQTPRRRRATPSIAEEITGELIGEAVLRLAEERLSVTKRVVESGRVRVHRTTTEKVQNVNVPLSSDSYEVTRVPIGKVVKKTPAVRETRTEIIIPVVEEVLVVERRLVLREELHIRKVRSVERHTEEFTLRVQNATVERVAPQNSDAGSPRSARSERPSTTGRSAERSAQPRKRRSQ
jgi:uncharacterized protein (TIGR02271 family)